MNINELPTLTWHFFKKPNKLIITNATFDIIIETEFECEDDFVLDAQSFDMLKKLGGPVKINNNTISFNKYKCQNNVVQLPELHINDILYTQIYDTDILKNATKFIGKQGALQGVLFNDNNDIFATDSFKFYFKRKIGAYTRFWSVPIQFIGILPKGNITLNFTASKVIALCDSYKMYASVYDNVVPKLEGVCDNFNTLYTINITNKPELTYLPCEIVKIEINNGVHFIFDNNEKSFVVDYDVPTNFNFECYITYTNLLSFLSDNMQIDFSNNMLRVNNEIIICYIRR